MGNKITNIIEESLFNEVKKTILSENKDTKETYHITCEGKPIDSFETEEIAMKHLDIYKKKHPEKEFIIEKKKYNSTSDMIEKLDQMGEEFEKNKKTKNMKKITVSGLAEAAYMAKEKGSKDLKFNGETYNVDELWKKFEEEESMCEQCGQEYMKEESDMEENAFVLAADAAKDAGKKEFEFPKGSGKMHKVTIQKDIEEIDEGGDVLNTIWNQLSDECLNEINPSDYSDEFEFGDNFLSHMVDIAISNGMINDEDRDETLDNLKMKYGYDVLDMFGNDNDDDDDDDDDDDINEGKDMCEQCGGDMNEGGMCEQCNDSKMHESKKIKLRLTESELVSMIKKMVEKSKINESKDEKEKIEIFYVMNDKDQVKNISKKESDAEKFLEKSLKDNGRIKSKIVYKKDYDNEKVTVSNIKTYTLNESVPGISVTKKAQSGSKKENDEYMREVEKKLKDMSTFDGNDNPEFPKQIGKGEKMAINPTKEQDEIIADTRGGGMEDLNYEYEPSENFKKRLKMSLEGDSKMGNSQDAANVVKTDTGKNLAKKSERKKEKDSKNAEISWGHSWKSPEKVVVVKENSKPQMSDVINEEIKKMKKIIGYNEKTQ